MDKTILENIQARMEAKKMSLDPSSKVVMANDMIKGISKLSLTEAKLLRLLIMQIKPTDEGFFMFNLEVPEFAKLLEIKNNSLYAEMEKIAQHLLSEVIYIGDGNPKHEWQRFPWLSYCAYKDGVITIELNKHLQPYLIGLQKWYTQYRLEDVIDFSSIHSIRVYELIAMALKDKKPYGNMKTRIFVEMDVLRKATNTEGKYESVFKFKKKVLDIAIRDINERSIYHVTYEDHKEGRRIAGFYFVVQSRTRYEAIGRKEEEEEKEKKRQAQDHKQLTTDDY